jgi:hypothetical protein
MLSNYKTSKKLQVVKNTPEKIQLAKCKSPKTPEHLKTNFSLTEDQALKLTVSELKHPKSSESTKLGNKRAH